MEASDSVHNLLIRSDFVRDLLALTQVHARELSGAAQASLRLALGTSL